MQLKYIFAFFIAGIPITNYNFMKIIETPIKDLLIIEPRVFEDSRGYFFESYNQKQFEANGLYYNFNQDNQSKSSYGVIRGLHYQLNPFGQTKLVRVLHGKILDVGVDLRKDSSTFGKWFGIELSDENKKQLLLPVGFAHGFSVLTETAVVAYKCEGIYNKESERGIFYADPKIGIDWQIEPERVLISEKDKVIPGIDNAEMNF